MAAESLERLLQQCATEPIHRLGRTQSFGFLLGFDADRRVALASHNAPEWLGPSAEALIGRRVDSLLPSRSVDAALAHAELARRRQSVQHLHHVQWPGRDTTVDVTVHASSGLVIIEAEPGEQEPLESSGAIESCTLELVAAHSVAELAESAVRTVARITAYDRVMLYRFAADGSGEVIAEHLTAGQASYLGLRYPAEDIPAQARALYLLNPTRVIADAHETGNPLATRVGLSPDLSLSVLRSVSPVHLQYLRNMGTAASMSISLIVDGRLWGLIACHHAEPLRPPLACRSMAELLGRLYSLAFSRAERGTLDKDIKALLLTPPGVEPLVAADAEPARRDAACALVAKLLNLTGVVSRIDGRINTWGIAASKPEAWLEALPVPDPLPPVQAVESLHALGPQLPALAPHIAGMLRLSLGPNGRDALLLLRDEVQRHVTWAGNPRKRVSHRGGQLLPRASFEAWLEAVRGHCEPWTAAEVELAGVLRGRLLETLAAHREQRELLNTRRAAQQQALLARELNHRVRNMLGLIKGLVHQTANSARSVQELSQRLHDRVHALSRAYAQIERAHWQPTPLADLVREEIHAFSEPGQVQCSGDPVQLEPNAYLSFALVIHELATNARKYGALSVAEGRLSVHWETRAGGQLQLDWRESGGPTVRPTTHRGFGTRVITQSLSHHLRGSATLDLQPGGLQATLIAGRGFVAGPALASAPAPRSSLRRAPERPMPSSVLVVEDDLVIALLAESFLERLGCHQVVVAGTQDDALQALRAQPFDAAVLDVNLGDHTSALVAERLAALGVPAVVATGYSDQDELPQPLRGLRRIFKPYDETELSQALRSVA